MSGFNSPNHTQVPNDLFDVMLPLMGEAELKVVLYAIRQTLGFHRGSDAISLSQFQKATGMSRQGVLNGLAEAIKRGVIKETAKGKRGVTVYGLVYEVDQSTKETSTGQQRGPVDTATSQRSRHTKESAKETGKKASAPSRKQKADPAPNVIPFEEKQSGRRKPYEDVEHAVRFGIINAWCSNLKAQPVGAFKKDSNHETAAELHRAGYTEDQVAQFVCWTREDTFWKGKTLKLEKVAELLPGWLANRQDDGTKKPKGIWSQPAPDTTRKSNLTPEERAALVESGKDLLAQARREAHEQSQRKVS